MSNKPISAVTKSTRSTTVVCGVCGQTYRREPGRLACPTPDCTNRPITVATLRQTLQLAKQIVTARTTTPTPPVLAVCVLPEGSLGFVFTNGEAVTLSVAQTSFVTGAE